MKNLFVIGLLCLSLVFSVSCSRKISGGYTGKARISGLLEKVIDGVKYDGNESWEQTDDTAFALVKDDGGTRSVEFSDMSFMENCKLTEGVLGQTCEIDIKGTTEKLTVDYVSFTDASAVGEDGVMISFQGLTSQSNVFVTMLFSGVPYEGN